MAVSQPALVLGMVVVMGWLLAGLILLAAGAWTLTWLAGNPAPVPAAGHGDRWAGEVAVFNRLVADWDRAGG